ncbi:MAG: DUF983 domain-containing protein [Rhodobacteraceae bacterium]|nr:DUF983 domain-containing protein [Paracoccaceae bacterium]
MTDTPASPAPARPDPRLIDEDAERALGPALRRGWRLRCPACGEGPMLRGYVGVRDACPACGTELHHQRADDGPSYLTILVVGHLLAPVMLWSYTVFRPEPWVLTSAFVAAAVGLSVWLLPRMKGMMVAFQWARRMHGFGEPAPEPRG